MSGYKLQENEIQFTLPSPNLNSKDFISCILCKPDKNSKYPDTLRAAILVHGIGGHKNTCYLSKLARKLSNEQGMYVIRMDFRNCGDSSKTGKVGRTLQNDIEDMNVAYSWLTNGGFENKKLFVDTLIGHSRGVVDVFNWQLHNQNKFVINLVGCAGRFIGSKLSDSIRKKHPNFEKDGGHFIKGFQDGEYRDVWVPLKETQSLSELNMITVKEITQDTDTLCVYGTKEQVIPLPDAARYANALGNRNTLVLIPDADHCYRGIVKIPESEWEKCDKPIIKSTGFIDYNVDVANLIADWTSPIKMNERFYEKTKNIHKYLPRWKNIDAGVFNFRDIGGYNTTDGKVVKYNFIYRSSDLSVVTSTGFNELHKLGVNKIFDLRLTKEINIKEINGKEKIDTVHLLSDKFDDPSENKILINLLKASFNWNYLSEVFIFILETIVPKYKDFFTYLANDTTNIPIVIYCNMGKDRTGVIVILLLLLCKVDPLIIAEEYALSQQGINNDINVASNQFIESINSLGDDILIQLDSDKPTKEWTLKQNGLSNLLHVDSKTALDTINVLNNQYGGVEEYLKKQVGLSLEEVEAIRDRLTITL